MQLPRFTFSGLLFAFQVILIILYGAFVDYEAYNPQDNVISGYYPMFQDVHIMLFVGFAFLMAFLKRHGYSSSGFTLVIGATIIQWGMLVSGLLSNAATGAENPTKVKIGIKSMLSAEFSTCTILISFATILGKASHLQYLIIAIFETVIFNINEMILTHYLVISDAGGSVIIHVFGCYFGLAAAKALERGETTREESPKESSTYNSDLIAMLGTCILWALWPSFNSSFLGPNAQQARVIINTYLSLATSCVVTYIISPLISKSGKFNMVHIQNATLAGGVAVGTGAHLFIKPWAAMLSGLLGGCICMVAFHYLTPILRKSAGIHDTCGVHNLHGLPGIFSGIVAAIAASTADLDEYGNDLFAIWPARAPKKGTAEFIQLSNNYTIPTGGSGRSKGGQAGMQLAAIPVTILMAVLTGLITGYIARLLDMPHKDELFDDKGSWELPENEYSSCEKYSPKDTSSHNRDLPMELSEVKHDTSSAAETKEDFTPQSN